MPVVCNYLALEKRKKCVDIGVIQYSDYAAEKTVSVWKFSKKKGLLFFYMKRVVHCIANTSVYREI